MAHRGIIGISILALAVAGCRSDEPVPPFDPGLDHFPIAVGTWVEYQVDSVWRDDDAGVHDSISYRLLERIEEHYIDPAGRPAQRIVRYVHDADGQWAPRDVWMSTRSAQYAEKLEENMRRLKLSFPLREGRAWDINVYNTAPALEVAVEEVGMPAVINGTHHAATVALRNTVPPNPIVTRNYFERYARHVGMVEQRWTEWDRQPVYDQTGAITGFTVRGFDLRMSAVAHGN
ncbi:MAG: hypothetical protein RBT71_11055 [Flavobacteriales bacterium]|jgi:hypothetical protein|nr:hypothetical protein [Flavobacteriales bacterium]